MTRIAGTALLLAIAMLVLLTMMSASEADAQTPCINRDMMSKLLDRQYSEVPIAGGLSKGGKWIQVFESKDGATWTIVQTDHHRCSRIVMAGKYWETVPKRAIVPKGAVI